MPFKSKEDRAVYNAAYQLKYYSIPEHRLVHNRDVRKSNARRKAIAYAWVDDYKMQRGCKVCGYKNHPAALDLHHRDPQEKSFSISSGASIRSLEAVKQEIAKCDVICANCHRIEHFA